MTWLEQQHSVFLGWKKVRLEKLKNIFKRRNFNFLGTIVDCVD